MSYLSDEQIEKGNFGRKRVRDLYEAHMKEADELLMEAVCVLEEILGGSKMSLCDLLSHPLSGDRHKLGEPCPPTERIAALISRINTRLTSNPT